MTEYNDRYCAFADILGFARLVQELPKDGPKFELLKHLLHRFHTPQPFAIDVDETDFKAQSISDAVAVSSKVSGPGLLAIFDALERLSLDLLCQGYLVRGALVKGPLYHDDHMAFGQALVRAYHMENEIARFPRIVVAREVREDMIAYSGQSAKEKRFPSIERLRQSDDGPMYIDVLKPVVALAKKSDSLYSTLSAEEKRKVDSYANIGHALRARIEESMDTPRHFEKVQWMGRYWNEVVPPNIPKFPKLRGSGLDHAIFSHGLAPAQKKP